MYTAACAAALGSWVRAVSYIGVHKTDTSKASIPLLAVTALQLAHRFPGLVLHRRYCYLTNFSCGMVWCPPQSLLPAIAWPVWFAMTTSLLMNTCETENGVGCHTFRGCSTARGASSRRWKRSVLPARKNGNRFMTHDYTPCTVMLVAASHHKPVTGPCRKESL